MATVTSIRNLLCLTLFTVALPAALGSVYPPVCYTKSQKCCFKYSACGFVIKRVSITVDCSFRKCVTVCKPYCIFISTKIPYRVCKTVKVPAGFACKKVKYYYKGIWIWKKVCKPKFIYKRVCKILYRVVKKKKCRRKCVRVCKTVSATCIKIRVLSFPKFCPKLECGKFFISGSAKYPGVKVGKTSKLIKVIAGKRTIKH